MSCNVCINSPFLSRPVSVPVLQMWQMHGRSIWERRGGNYMESPGGGVEGCVCVWCWSSQLASMQTGGGGAKLEDEVIGKVRGGEEGGSVCGWSLDEWHLFQRWAQPRRLELLPLAPPSPRRLPARLRPLFCCDSEGFACLSGMN